MINLPAPLPRDGAELTIAYAGRLPPQEAERETGAGSQRALAGAARGRAGRAAGAEFSLQQPELLVSAGQPPDYATARSASRSRRSTRWWRAASCRSSRRPTSRAAPSRASCSRSTRTSRCAIWRCWSAASARGPETVSSTAPTRPPTTCRRSRAAASTRWISSSSTNPRQVRRTRHGGARDRHREVLRGAARRFTRTRPSRSRWSRASCPAATARRTSRRSTSRCRRRPSRGATIPSSSTTFPEFFLAHELAHQWWGQAVGWRNYHEQWLSEGFAQYFAALYAQHGAATRRSATCSGSSAKWA